MSEEPDPATTNGRGAVLDSVRQRRVLESIAELIKQNYFDEAVARRCAEQVLESEIDPAGAAAVAFAERLTEALQPLDRHFKVQWGEWKPRVRKEAEGDVDAPAIVGSTSGALGIITVRDFENADDAAEAETALDALRTVAGSRAVVLDLRDVPGGWPTMVELLIGALVGEEPVHILTFRSRQGAHESWSRVLSDAPELTDKPLAVLVDGETASAAESCAYALQTMGRAKVVGEPTAGAANPGAPFDTGVGFSVFISTGSPVDPRTGTNWEGRGVAPDVVSPDISPANLRAILL